MKTLRFTDPNSNYGGSFKMVEVKVDLESLSASNCTVYEVESDDIKFATSIGLTVLVPWVTTVQELKGLAVSTGLKCDWVEDATILQDSTIQLATFTGVQENGTDGLVPSDQIHLTFSKSVPGLTVGAITLVGATKGTLTVVGGTNSTQWILAISNITGPNQSLVGLSIARWVNSGITYGVLGNAVVEVFNTLPLNVTYTAVQQVGVTGTVSSTGVLLTFSETVPGLTASKITVVGATKGVLTDNEDGTYLLAISTITVADGANITVSIANWAVAGILYTPTTTQPVNVVVFKAA